MFDGQDVQVVLCEVLGDPRAGDVRLNPQGPEGEEFKVVVQAMGSYITGVRSAWDHVELPNGHECDALWLVVESTGEPKIKLVCLVCPPGLWEAVPIGPLDVRVLCVDEPQRRWLPARTPPLKSVEEVLEVALT